MSEVVKSFKTRVKECAIDNAFKFQEAFVDSEYCICSKAFEDGFKIVKALDGNYLHLIGVSTSMPAESFFKKCINKTLTEDDFGFEKKGVTGSSLKGAVRDKIRVIPELVSMFQGGKITVQSGFKKNKIDCAFASSDNKCTLGFAESGHPKSLLNGNYLENDKCFVADLILKRKSGCDKFEELVYKNPNDSQDYKQIVREIVTDELYNKL